MELIDRIKDGVVEGNITDVEKLTKEAAEQKVDIQKIMDAGFMPGLDVVGEKFTAGELFLPEMLMAGMA